MDAVQTEAIAILSKMQLIAEREMMIAGVYLTSSVLRPELAAEGAVCQGHGACAVGSMWLAAGVDLEEDGHGGMVLPTASPGNRDDELDENPALALAYETMNKVCGERIQELEEEQGFEYNASGMYDGWMEVLFESIANHDSPQPGEDERQEEARMEMIDMCARAKSEIASLANAA